ncbi:MAG: S9 family peptidase, partial [Duncaniella sp.]|nr:S9 family peptidase [Duncaniella sp.]
VYPANTVNTHARPTFTTDGQGWLEVSEDGRSIVARDIATGKVTETVMSLDNTRENRLDGRIERFILSPEGSRILVTTGTTPLYRRSYTAAWWVYEIRSRLLRPLSDTHAVQRAPLFSPDGRIVAFAAPDGNIWLRKTDYNTEVAVTTDGAPGRVINGVPDWVYEEEFATDCSMAWAPDSQTLCWLRYDESDVPLYSFALYEGACKPRKEYALYPGLFSYKYPVAGQPNSVVTLHSYDVDNRKIKNLDLPGRDIEYIPRIAFGGGDPDRLMALGLDRDQTHLTVFAVNPRSGVARAILSEESREWLPTETYEDVTFEQDGFVLLSARSGRLHAYLYSYAGALVRQLTQGDWDVTAYYGADPKGYRWFQTTSSGAINRTILRTDPKGLAKTLSPEKGWSSAWFTPSMDRWCLVHSTSDTPPVATLRAAASDKVIRTLEENKKAATEYASAPRREFTTIPAADGSPMNAWIIRPEGFTASRKYPAIIYQYSGPGSQEVCDRWRTDWTQYAALRGYVVICVDTHGTGGRGRAWETSVYRHLGTLEALDLNAAARWAGEQGYIDPARIGLTGWSYGGYQTLLTISGPQGADTPFAAAVAIAPVTDWRYYDTIYAERYMLTPQQNPDGYRESAPLTYAGEVAIPLLIIHGTADDNVHLSNTMEYVSAMEQAGRFCDMLLFPNMNHSINGCNSRLTVYSKMLRFFDLNL